MQQGPSRYYLLIPERIQLDVCWEFLRQSYLGQRDHHSQVQVSITTFVNFSLFEGPIRSAMAGCQVSLTFG